MIWLIIVRLAVSNYREFYLNEQLIFQPSHKEHTIATGRLMDYTV